MPPGKRSRPSPSRPRGWGGPSEPPSDDPREEDLDDFSDATRDCPKCRAQLYDDAEVCYRCGHSLSGKTAEGPPAWVLVVIGLLLAAFVLPWLLRIF